MTEYEVQVLCYLGIGIASLITIITAVSLFSDYVKNKKVNKEEHVTHGAKFSHEEDDSYAILAAEGIPVKVKKSKKAKPKKRKSNHQRVT